MSDVRDNSETDIKVKSPCLACSRTSGFLCHRSNTSQWKTLVIRFEPNIPIGFSSNAETFRCQIIGYITMIR